MITFSAERSFKHQQAKRHRNTVRLPCDINFFFYFKIVSQQDETQRSPEGPKPIEPSRTEAPLIIAMSLSCRTRGWSREKKKKGWRGWE